MSAIAQWQTFTFAAIRAGMARHLALIASAVLCGCNPSDDGTRAPESKPMATVASVPLDGSSGFLEGYSVRVPRRGDILWNGQPVGTAVLKSYLQQVARLPVSAGRLSVAFEPGVAQGRAEEVRRQVVGSGLCDQHRCAEVGWDVKRPVVN